MKKHIGDSKWTDFLYYQMDITHPTLLSDFRMQQWKHLADNQTTDMEFVTGYGGDLLEELTYMSRKPKEDAVLIWTVVNNYPEDLQEFLIEAATKNLKPVASPAIINSVYGAEFVPEIKHMKASPYTDNASYLKDRQFTVTPKLSGVTCIIYKTDDEMRMYSPSGARLTGCEHIIEDIQSRPITNMVLIGQLVDKTSFNETGRIRSINTKAAVRSEDTSQLVFYAADMLTAYEFNKKISTKTYKERRAFIEHNITETDVIQILPIIYRGSDIKRLANIVREQHEKNIDSIYINVDDAFYSYGYSQNYLTRHDINNGDLIVLDYIEDDETPGKIKGFIVEYRNSEILISKGFTDEERKFYWYYKEHYIGWVMQIQYHKEIIRNGIYDITSPVFIQMKPIGTKIRYSY